MPGIRDRVANYEDLSREIVEIPEWGGEKIEVRGVSLGERNKIVTQSRREVVKVDEETGKKSKVTETDLSVYYPALVIASSFDPEDGSKVFTAKDREMLNGKNSRAMDRLAKKAMELSGLDAPSDDDEDEGAVQQEIDAAGKDSSSTEDSGHDS